MKAVNKSSFISNFSKGVCVFVCSFFAFSSPSLCANEFIKGFEMTSCVKTKCTTLIVNGLVERGILAPLFAFEKATLTQKVKSGDAVETKLHALDGYYDPHQSEVVLRGVSELGGGDALINLKTGEIKVFAKK